MINNTNLSREQKIFFDALVASGVPESEAVFRSQMQQIADNSHLAIANASKYSAFWNFVQSAIAAPLRAIVEGLVKIEMPGFYAKTATGKRLDLIAWQVGIERKKAVKMVGKITFCRSAGAVGIVEIPKGTRVCTVPVNGNIYRVATLEYAAIPIGELSTSVLCEAAQPGENYNLGASYYSILDSDTPNIGDVTNNEEYLIIPGADEEPDEELRLRIRDRFLAAGSWHSDAKYRAIITERAGIRPDRVYFSHTNPRGPGSADCYIIFEAGETPSDYLQDLNNYIGAQGNHGHGDDLVCKPIPEVKINVNCTCRFSANTLSARQAELMVEVSNMIRCAFWDNSDFDGKITRAWPFSVFSFSKLSAEIHLLIPEITGMVFNLSEVATTLQLPKLETLSVTARKELYD